MDVNSHVMSRKFPGIEVEPIIRDFNLKTVNELLLEYSVPITESITPGRHIHGGHAVQKAGRKAPKPSVAKGSIVLL